MVKVDILGGLREALTRGESLKQAMISFYNAGYKKQEIEGAARALQMQPTVQVQTVTTPQTQPKGAQKKAEKPKAIQRVSSYGPVTPQKTKSLKKIREGIDTAIGELERIEFPNGSPSNKQPPSQNISEYGEKTKTKSKITIALLMIFLILLLGIIISLFIFKEQILEILNNSEFFSGLF